MFQRDVPNSTKNICNMTTNVPNSKTIKYNKSFCDINFNDHTIFQFFLHIVKMNILIRRIQKAPNNLILKSLH